MKNLLTLLAVTLSTLFISTSFASAQDTTFHARVRLHGLTVEPGDGVGVSGVVEAVDVPNSPGRTLGLVGLGGAGKKYDLGVHLGMLTLAGDTDLVLDVRNTVLPTKNTLVWTNVRWVGLEDPELSNLYFFVMADYKLPFTDTVYVGLETEDVVYLGEALVDLKDFGVGPNLLVDLSERTRMELAYQAHTNTNVDNQLWLRLDVKL